MENINFYVSKFVSRGDPDFKFAENTELINASSEEEAISKYKELHEVEEGQPVLANARKFVFNAYGIRATAPIGAIFTQRNSAITSEAPKKPSKKTYFVVDEFVNLMPEGEVKDVVQFF